MFTNILFSILFVCLSVVIYYFITPKLKSLKIFYLLGVFISSVLILIYSIIHYITGEGITESAIYHIRFGLGDAGVMEHINLVIISIVLLVAILAVLVMLYLKKPYSKERFKSPKIRYAAYGLIVFFMIASLLLNPVTHMVVEEFQRGEIFYDRPDNIYGFIEQDSPYDLESGRVTFPEDSEFYQYFDKPEIEQINDSKNLVFIYAESVERTFFNQDTFPGLTDNLQDIESNSISFTNIIEGELSGRLRYTMAGIVASQCGFPSISTSYGNSMSGMDTYLEGTNCLGDLLKSEDYYLSFYGGADLNFAGKGDFFKTHGFDEIMGKRELESRVDDPDYRNRWGYYDDTLFDKSYERFKELSEEEDKFAMFMLTLDTHHPRGHPSQSCDGMEYKDGDNEFLNAIYCADYLLPQFIEKIRESEYSDDTVIVVASDHLAIRNTATDLLEKHDRKNLFMIDSPDIDESKKVDSLGTLMDVTPTILPFIGYEGKMGFGRDLINRNETDEDIEHIHNNIYRFTENLMEFWGFPTIEDSLEINPDERRVFIDDRENEYPILIEMNENLDTTLRFDFDTPDDYGLGSYIESSNEGNYYLYVDFCSNMLDIAEEAGNYDGLCLFLGTKDNYDVKSVNEKTTFTREEIMNLLDIN